MTIFLSLPHSLLHLMDMASNSDIQLALCTVYTFGSDILIAPTRCTELVRICNTTWTKSRLAIIVLCYFILKKIMHSLLYTPFLIIWTLIVAIIVSSYNPPFFLVVSNTSNVAKDEFTSQHFFQQYVLMMRKDKENVSFYRSLNPQQRYPQFIKSIVSRFHKCT